MFHIPAWRAGRLNCTGALIALPSWPEIVAQVAPPPHEISHRRIERMALLSSEAGGYP
jgi:hypothetical protein